MYVYRVWTNWGLISNCQLNTGLLHFQSDYYLMNKYQNILYKSIEF